MTTTTTTTTMMMMMMVMIIPTLTLDHMYYIHKGVFMTGSIYAGIPI